MNRSLKCLLILGLAIIAANRGSSAQAQGAWGFPYWYGGTSFYQNRNYVPPYYALFPPVYYSVPVPRTYGYSPFAYPPGWATPEVQVQEVATPKLMVNPYVPKADRGEVKPNQTTATPAMIYNRYVDQPAVANGIELARQPLR